MPQANWDVFTQLPGAATSNFEKLCRSLVRRHYGRFGHFRELANQPHSDEIRTTRQRLKEMGGESVTVSRERDGQSGLPRRPPANFGELRVQRRLTSAKTNREAARFIQFDQPGQHPVGRQ